MRGLFALPLLAALGLSAAPALAAASLPPVDPAPASQPLFVELVLNGQQAGDIIPMTLVSGRAMVNAKDLRAAGVAVSGDGQMDVGHLNGVQATYDSAGQELKLDVSPDLLPTNHVEVENRPRNPTVANVGAMLNYDAYVQSGGGVTSASLWTEQRVFGPAGTFSNDGILRTTTGRSYPGSSGYIRYDTRYRYIDEDHAVSATAGDLITQSLPWTTSVRMGGIQIARDFQVRPDLLTMPLPSFAGKTAVPSAVDLFIDGYRQQSANVAPGRFVLDNIPVVNGAGQATIVTTDAVGRQISTTIPFYVAPTLLKPGLLDGGAEIGFLRRGYGISSFDYGRLAASGTMRLGLTPHLTVEAHGEATRGLALGGGGLVWAPGLFGALSVSAAASHGDGRTGFQWTASYNYSTRVFSIAVEHDQRDRAYRDLGSFDLASTIGAVRSDRVVGNVNMGRMGSLGLAYIDGRVLDGLRSRLLSLSYSRPLGRRASLFATLDHDFHGTGGTTAQLRLIIPFGRNSVSAGMTRDGAGHVLGQVDYAHAIPTEGGLGVNASVAVDGDGHAIGQGTATWRARTVELQAGGSYANGQSLGWASATGSVVVMDHDWFAANQVNDAFAVVSTEGVAGVPVSYENQPLGVTDRSGHLFVPSISAYHPGRFAIDTLSLDADQMADTVETRIALRSGSGALIHMPVRHVHNVVLSLVDAAGHPLAPGGKVERPNAPASEIGWDGVVYLEDVGGAVPLAVTRRDGSHCRAAITVAPNAQPMMQIGPVPCR